MRDTARPNGLLRTFCALAVTASLGVSGLGCAATNDAARAAETGDGAEGVGVTEQAGGTDEDSAPSLVDCAIRHDPDFGGVDIDSGIDDFNALGFEYGDSVDIRFSNGYELADQPYYNGYYVPYGKSLLVGYPGYGHMRTCINCGDDLWEIAGLTEGDTATVTLCERGKYRDVQDAQDLQYSTERDDYATDEVFANFRNVVVGEIAPDTLFRSSSPVDNRDRRAAHADALARSAGIRCILDLADDDGDIAGYLADDSHATPYFQSLYEEGDVIPVALTMNFGSEEYHRRLASGLTAMAEHEGPYLVHCTEGKDRTGFMCMLLEALCGASYDEVVADYMVTYDNYYGINQKSDPGRYATIVGSLFDPMVQVVTGEGTDVRAADLKASAEAYLRGVGMTQEQVSALVARLTDALA